MRLERKKHIEAEQRLKTAILLNRDYPGKEDDLELVKRKQRERGREHVRRILGGGA